MKKKHIETMVKECKNHYAFDTNPEGFIEHKQ